MTPGHNIMIPSQTFAIGVDYNRDGGYYFTPSKVFILHKKVTRGGSYV